MADWLSSCTKQDWGTSGGSWTRQPGIICLHSTEGNSFPSYSNGQSAPHFTIDVRTNERRQHISMGVAARALANPSGGVETNRAGVIQIEIIGTCDPNNKSKSGWLWVPGMTTAQQANLASLMHEIASNKSINWVCNVAFKSYPDSYGSGNGVRLSSSNWNTYKGVLGHQHVPENDHGDPGNINIAAIMGVAPTTPPDSADIPSGSHPAFPLPSGEYFGPKEGPPESHSGYYSSADNKNLKTWQNRMAQRGWSIGIDGYYGPETDDVATSFQAEKGLRVDGLIGVQTWDTAWTAPVT